MKKEMTQQEIHDVQLTILDFIDSICKKYQLKYSLAYGTLIGAIRHKGFIPWDDDVDIFMPRDDYETFISIFNCFQKENGENLPYIIINYNNAYFTWTKVIDCRTKVEENEDFRINDYGIWVDIFPYDNMPNPLKIESVVFRKKLDFYRKLSMYKVLPMKHASGRNILYQIMFRVSKLILWPFPTTYWSKKWNILEQKYNNKQCNYVGFGAIYPSQINSFKKTILEEYINVEFENHIYKSVKEYDYYLSTIYGEYMTLPPENDRVPKHSYRAFWIEK